jgi:hypothetical protein
MTGVVNVELADWLTEKKIVEFTLTLLFFSVFVLLDTDM